MRRGGDVSAGATLQAIGCTYEIREKHDVIEGLNEASTIPMRIDFSENRASRDEASDRSDRQSDPKALIAASVG